jgi:outer membrane protein assembly factor BamB
MSAPASPPRAIPSRAIRWWPLPVILVLACVGISCVRTFYGHQRQDQNLATAKIVIVTFLLLLLWSLVLSRLRWKTRLAAAGGLFALIALVPALFRIHGVSGDLVPILEWRWSQASGPLALPSTNVVASREAPPVLILTNDYPQFLGPHRNATVDQPQLARDWKAQPPQQLWVQPVGRGWSGFAVVGNQAITQEQRGEEEAVVCYELRSGSVIWAHHYPAHYRSSLAGEGPRATPTISENRVFALGSTGILSCLDLRTGKLLWSRDIVRDNHSEVSDWGISCSPLLMDELVVISAGGGNERSLVAYRAGTGEFVWGGGSDGSGYSSPSLVTLAAVPQILIFNAGGVSAHQAADGKTLWKYPWPGGHPHVSMPVVLSDDRVLVSSGYGVGSELLRIEKDSEGKFRAKRIWKSTRLKAKFTNVVYRDGYIYGLDDGIMVCVDVSNGELKWKEGRYGHGQEILAGNLLLVTAESGDIILLEPNPVESRELGRFSALKGKMWNPPALAGAYLVIRNDAEAACYRLPIMKP